MHTDTTHTDARVRGHWDIENKLHYVTLGGDTSRVRTCNAPQNIAAMRSLVIGALRAAGWANIAYGLRWAGQAATTSTHCHVTAQRLSV